MDTNSAAPVAVAPITPAMLPLDVIDRDDNQLRRDWRHDDGQSRLDALTNSVKHYGVLQPLLVRHNPDKPGRYTVIAGGRRLVAAKRNALPNVPVVIRGEQSTAAYVLQLIENLQRQDLSPMDEARAYQEVMDLEGINAGELSKRVHVTQQHIRERVRIYRDEILSEAVRAKRIAPSVAREINKTSEEVKDALRMRVARGDAINLETIATIRQELAVAGLVPSRHPMMEEVDAHDNMEQDARLLSRDNHRHASRVTPVCTLAEDIEFATPSQPQIAQARPDPFDAVARRGSDSDNMHYTIDPAHVVVERPPSRYGQVEVKSSTPPPTRTMPDVQDVVPALGVTPRSTFGMTQDATDVLALNRADKAPNGDQFLTDYLARMDWDAFQATLLYGVARGWTCAGLLSHLIALKG